jgi:hypothetical protein
MDTEEVGVAIFSRFLDYRRCLLKPMPELSLSRLKFVPKKSSQTLGLTIANHKHLLRPGKSTSLL